MTDTLRTIMDYAVVLGCAVMVGGGGIGLGFCMAAMGIELFREARERCKR